MTPIKDEIERSEKMVVIELEKKLEIAKNQIKRLKNKLIRHLEWNKEFQIEMKIKIKDIELKYLREFKLRVELENDGK